MRKYDPAADAARAIQDRADDDELEHGSDPENAKAIFRKRYDTTTAFEQAQHGYNRLVDEDRLAKVTMRAEEKKANADNTEE